MKREIKFRGRSKQTGEWLYGYLLKNTDGDVAIVPPNECDVYEVDPDTVGQFTGLYDEDGKEIYEGDFLQIDPTTQVLGYVKWHNKMAQFVVGVLNRGQWYSIADREMKVVNQDLLKGGTK